MKKAKVLLFTLIASMAMLLLTACMGEDFNITINQDGSGEMAISFMFEESFYNMMESQGEIPSEYANMKDTKISIDGINYYAMTEKSKFSTSSELKSMLTDIGSMSKHFPLSTGSETEGVSNSGVFTYADVSATTFKGSIPLAMPKEQLDMIKEYENSGLMKKDSMVIRFSVTMPNAVVDANGVIDSSNPKKVTWTIKDWSKNAALYATTDSNVQVKTDKVAPTITGVVNNKVYNKKVTLKVNDNDFLYEVKLNNENAYGNETIAAEGKYTLVAKDFAGNEKKVTFTIDKTAPKVTGVANNKTYKKGTVIKYSDKYGIKSATLNGKKVKTGTKVAKAGKYTLKVVDKAGNAKTVKFTVK